MSLPTWCLVPVALLPHLQWLVPCVSQCPPFVYYALYSKNAELHGTSDNTAVTLKWSVIFILRSLLFGQSVLHLFMHRHWVAFCSILLSQFFSGFVLSLLIPPVDKVVGMCSSPLCGHWPDMCQWPCCFFLLDRTAFYSWYQMRMLVQIRNTLSLSLPCASVPAGWSLRACWCHIYAMRVLQWKQVRFDCGFCLIVSLPLVNSALLVW